MSSFHIRPLGPGDEAWVKQLVKDRWGAEEVVAHGVIYYPHELPGFVAIQDGDKVGLVTYHIEKDSCEIVTLDSLRPSSGVGTGLIEAVEEAARRSGCRRLWLITTNDNLNALHFYQKRGFRLVAIHRNALEVARSLKPEIPLIGLDGIPLQDEIELEMPLSEPKTCWTFRSPVQTDWPQIATLLSESGLPQAGAQEHLAGFLLAFRQGRLVGTAGLERYDNAALLRSVAVAEGERGKGLGQELVRRLLDQARVEGKEMVVLLTTTAASFFPRFGFRTVTREDIPPSVRASQEFQGACPASAAVMMLNLRQPPSRGPSPAG
ncbi:MAG: arsenic resistance N-acetyltransferase ArsN2 [Firmicutes bacterium]|nr:arsenic resistance N-acetyltransferase ArsN2 [Bacillota bacterium]